MPEFLRKLTRWIRWTLKKNKQGKLTKVPHGSTGEPDQWLTFDDALAAGPVNATQGIGLVMTGGIDIETKKGKVRIFAIDCDACRDPETGILTPWGFDMIKHYRDTAGGAFVEVTPSGKGVRVWIAVRDFPKTLAKAKVKLDHPPAPNCGDKGVEVQAFGYGAKQFVTTTGNLQRGDDEGIPVVQSLDYLVETFGMAESDDELGTDALRIGTGAPPSIETIEAKLGPSPSRALIFDAEWRDASTGKDPSASGAYWTVAREVLKVANGHGAVALEFLATRTAWGLGAVEESADPGKYSSRRWIAAELRRVAAKDDKPSTKDVFDNVGTEAEAKAASEAGKAKAAKASGPYATRSAFDMMTDPPVEWIVQGYVSEASVGMLAGEPGTGKSGILIDLAGHLLHGLDWLGCRTEPGSVIWFAGEGKRDVGPRLKAWHQRNKIDVSAPGARFFEVVAPIVSMSEAEGLRRLSATLADAKARHGHAPAVVVLDTLSTLWGGESENDGGDAGKWIRHLMEIAAAYGCTILIVHHLAKTAQSNRKAARVPTLNSIRGSGAFAGDADFLLATAQTGEATSELHNIKQRSDKKAPPVALKIEAEPVGMNKHGEVVTAMVVVQDKYSAKDREKEADAEVGKTRAKALGRILSTAVGLFGDDPSSELSKTAVAGTTKGDRNENFRAFDEAASPGVGFFKSNGKSRERFTFTEKGRAAASGESSMEV